MKEYNDWPNDKAKAEPTPINPVDGISEIYKINNDTSKQRIVDPPKDADVKPLGFITFMANLITLLITVGIMLGVVWAISIIFVSIIGSFS